MIMTVMALVNYNGNEVGGTMEVTLESWKARGRFGKKKKRLNEFKMEKQGK